MIGVKRFPSASCLARFLRRMGEQTSPDDAAERSEVIALSSTGAGLFRSCRGSVSVEGAVALSVLVAAFAGLMAIEQEIYAKDRLARAARAAARAIALDEGADACTAIRRELALPGDFSCNGKWEITIDWGSPSSLFSMVQGGTSTGTTSGEMVLVRIGWIQESSSVAEEQVQEPELGTIDGEILSDTEGGTGDRGVSGTDGDRVPMTAMGIARREEDAG